VKDAIGNDKLIGILLPEAGITPEEDIQDAKEVIKRLGIASLYIDISPVVNAFIKSYPKVAERVNNRLVYPNAYGNLKARTRMIFLYGVAKINNGIVVGTTDKSEWFLGYFTKYGDGAVDFEPISDLYKTQVRKLGEYLKIPERIITKKSSPRLLPNQTAEGEIGVDYETIDLILYYSLERKYSRKQVVTKLKVDRNIVDRVLKMVKKNSHKRKLPPRILLDNPKKLIDDLYNIA
jgi:NAD+ synthase